MEAKADDMNDYLPLAGIEGDEQAAKDYSAEDMDSTAGEEAQNAAKLKEFRAAQSPMDKQYAKDESVPKDVHILGTGSIGKLVAHSLLGLPNRPSVTLLFHRPMLYQKWTELGQKITITDDGVDDPRTGAKAELLPYTNTAHMVDQRKGQPDIYNFSEEVKPHEAAELVGAQQAEQAAYKPLENSNSPIHNLIVTTKAFATISAIRRIKHRLSPTSTICLLQNGMGIIDEVNTALFPDPATRPNYMQGIITHGVNTPASVAARDPFTAIHAGHGTIALALLPRPSSRYLLRTLARTPVLCAVAYTPTELLQQQLEKLAVNSILNPLTVLLDCRNGSILANFALLRTIRLMLAETSLIIRTLPELTNLPNITTRFSPTRLEHLTMSVARRTSDNISSMLADVRKGSQTEAQWINGYIVKRGEEVGITAVVNYAIMQAVIAKSAIVQNERREGEVGFEEEQDGANLAQAAEEGVM